MAAILLCVFLVGLVGEGCRTSYRRGRFLSANEKSFLLALDAALGEGYRVFAQVRLAELVEVEAKGGNARRRAALNKVFGKSVDFLVCRAGSFDPILAIEVDDRSHLLAARRERDALVDRVFREIGLPLLRVKARREYLASDLRERLAEAGVAGGGYSFPMDRR